MVPLPSKRRWQLAGVLLCCPLGFVPSLKAPTTAIDAFSVAETKLMAIEEAKKSSAYQVDLLDSQPNHFGWLF
jgi:hypothetical protein